MDPSHELDKSHRSGRVMRCLKFYKDLIDCQVFMLDDKVEGLLFQSNNEDDYKDK